MGGPYSVVGRKLFRCKTPTPAGFRPRPRSVPWRFGPTGQTSRDTDRGRGRKPAGVGVLHRKFLRPTANLVQSLLSTVRVVISWDEIQVHMGICAKSWQKILDLVHIKIEQINSRNGSELFSNIEPGPWNSGPYENSGSQFLLYFSDRFKILEKNRGLECP